MIDRLRLFKLAGRKVMSNVSSKRGVYSDPIYEYPFNYINTKVHPSRNYYRETYIVPDWKIREHKWSLWMKKFFWAYWFYMMLSHPEFYMGHGSEPDSSKFTNEELGIPPDDEGPYLEWLEKTNSSWS